ncbi:hypothetical protein HDU67_005790 [Dinochytrium kinnereticum]|nr:hypothetical protein HDU67_005790 [Dinochytrium kinnereticum]
MDKVTESLFISDLPTSINPSLLQRHKITHTICAGFSLAEVSPPNPHHTHLPGTIIHALPLDDDEVDPTALLRALPDALTFIEEAMGKGGRVLVHCVAGVSRSAAVCVAWVAKARGCGIAEALETVSSARLGAMPNSNFIRQLQVFCDLGCAFDTADSRCQAKVMALEKAHLSKGLGEPTPGASDVKDESRDYEVSKPIQNTTLSIPLSSFRTPQPLQPQQPTNLIAATRKPHQQQNRYQEQQERLFPLLQATPVPHSSRNRWTGCRQYMMGQMKDGSIAQIVRASLGCLTGPGSLAPAVLGSRQRLVYIGQRLTRSSEVLLEAIDKDLAVAPGPFLHGFKSI